MLFNRLASFACPEVGYDSLSIEKAAVNTTDSGASVPTTDCLASNPYIRSDSSQLDTMSTLSAQLKRSLQELTSSQLNELMAWLGEESFECQQCDEHYWGKDQCENLEDENFCCECLDDMAIIESRSRHVEHQHCDCEPCARHFGLKKQKLEKKEQKGEEKTE